jgi:hypothetical protein
MPEAAVKRHEQVIAADAPAPEKDKPKERPKEIEIELQTPVQAHGEMLKKMKFRRPTGGDIMEMGDGYPININWATGQIAPNPPVMGMMMSRLAAVPPSTIKALDAEDWSTCAHALMVFFPPGAQAMRF